MGSVSHLRNTEIMVISGPRELVEAAVAAGGVTAASTVDQLRFAFVGDAPP